MSTVKNTYITLDKKGDYRLVDDGGLNIWIEKRGIGEKGKSKGLEVWYRDSGYYHPTHVAALLNSFIDTHKFGLGGGEFTIADVHKHYEELKALNAEFCATLKKKLGGK